MKDAPQNQQRAQFINKIWSARVQLDKKEKVIVRGREITPVAWSASDLLMEALRKDGHIPHVKAPKPPRILYACSEEIRDDPLKVASLADAWAESRKAVTGRAHQRNSPVMASVVISLPKEMIDQWPTFRDASLQWLKDKYGERLKLAIEHLDEENPHLHAYLIANCGIGKDGLPFSEPFGEVHEGYGESRKARRGAIEKSGSSQGAKTGKAFVVAMKEYQDKFHNDVARHFNLTRLGPQKAKKNHMEAVLDRDMRQAEEARVEAEKMKEKAFEEVRAAMVARRMAYEEIARKKAEAEKDSEIIVKQLMEDAQERAKVESQRILKVAKLAVEEQKRTIRALMEGDDKVAVRVFRENAKLKEDLRLTERALAIAKKEVDHWKSRFDSAYSWLKEAVGKLEAFRFFGFSHIFKTGGAGGSGSGTGSEMPPTPEGQRKTFELPKPAPKRRQNEDEDSY